MGAKEMVAVVERMKARNDEHAKNEGLRESESLKVAHERRAKLRQAAASLGALRRQLSKAPEVVPTTLGLKVFAIDMNKQLAEVVEVLDLVLRELLASGSGR